MNIYEAGSGLALFFLITSLALFDYGWSNHYIVDKSVYRATEVVINKTIIQPQCLGKSYNCTSGVDYSIHKPLCTELDKYPYFTARSKYDLSDRVLFNGTYVVECYYPKRCIEYKYINCNTCYKYCFTKLTQAKDCTSNNALCSYDESSKKYKCTIPKTYVHDCVTLYKAYPCEGYQCDCQTECVRPVADKKCLKPVYNCTFIIYDLGYYAIPIMEYVKTREVTLSHNDTNFNRTFSNPIAYNRNSPRNPIPNPMSGDGSWSFFTGSAILFCFTCLWVFVLASLCGRAVVMVDRPSSLVSR